MDWNRIRLHSLDATPPDEGQRGSDFLAGLALGMLVMFIFTLVWS